MADSALITTDEVEDLVVAVIKRRHPEHLAKLERQREKDAQTFERYETVSHMASEAGTRLSGDTLPAGLVGVIGSAGAPIRTEYETLNVPMQLGMQVSVLGQRRRDTLRRRDVMFWTTVECVLERVPRSGPISSIALIDWEPREESDQQRLLAEMRAVFEVTVADMLTVAGGLPADDSPWPPGGPLGPPPDGQPYTPPAEAPEVTQVGFTIEKEPITE